MGLCVLPRLRDPVCKYSQLNDEHVAVYTPAVTAVTYIFLLLQRQVEIAKSKPATPANMRGCTTYLEGGCCCIAMTRSDKDT